MKTEQSHQLWLDKDDRYIWHSMKPYNPNATVVVTEAKGCWVTDVAGNKYLDAMAGLWCVNVGYGREELAEAAYEQLKTLPYFPLTQSHLPAIQLGEKLNELLGDEYVIFFSNSGSEANETAFKIARQYHQQRGEPHRYKIISRYRAYHGNSMGALAATGQAQRKYKYEPLAPGFIHVPPPDRYRDPDAADDPRQLRAVKAVDDVMTWELSETIAAMIMEPIITGGGVLMPPDGYMKAVKEVCEKHGALLIVDEVICGFGRTGKPFGFMHEGIKPDIITMAKGITSAYLPLAATAVRKEIYEAFKGTDEYDYFRHVNTFGGHPASCALALKNIEIMETEHLFDRSREAGEWLLSALKTKLADHPYVGDVRGRGLLVGIELVADQTTKEPLDVSLVNQVISRCKEHGVIIGKNGATVAGYNNVLTLSPPLCISDDELSFLVRVLTEALAQIK
ncbi:MULTISPECIES: taurine-pyruvate aminotransferase [Geobacillus]|jgi:taurine-pyruvate aminotransferase|uniref:Adenosylmethionine-8-amino-7-oxononanoateaminotransferase n=5 Tax=Geobacillus thermodenitrificans TaxID=33940 RepID=A4IMV2_GEOTN|nr:MULTISPECIES: taurine-pyruvate aminotransferase [Geobacillus]ABO66656.1 Adenosylmethionine-8-amino-7-oxononanoateaminotransferase [Geobacillus thermodenitrificans NG80-2]ALP81259.1 taurine-pyruvate transaminase [Geobacillus thermodenitrificans subsp. thermodenitrificans DSM 465]ARA96983.1 aspartate aminotransferase family protein [Geobacillus thermodenitrificans]ARP42408.1 Taurine--pyruvate aminotransferase [Geobacillus thermodenitrificans]ATO36256.1 aspartate aminotransferase family protei